MSLRRVDSTPANRVARPGELIIPIRERRNQVVAPAWGPIPNQSDQVLVLIAPFDLSQFLTAGDEPIVYEDIGAQLPPGLTLDVNTGIVTGTPSQIDVPILVSIRATNDAGQDVGSFTWEITL